MSDADPASLAVRRLDPPPAVADAPLVVATRELAARLAPQAQRLDVDGVTGEQVEAAAAAGLLGLGAPADPGGTEPPAPVDREITELLSGASGDVWFVLSQHRTPLRMVATVAAPPVREQWLRPLVTGELLAGVAFTHLRRPGPPPVRAMAAGDGWLLDGHVDWLTSWGLAGVFLVGAQADDGRLVFGLVPGVEGDGLTVSGPLPLAAMSGTRTTAATLSGVPLPPERLVAVLDPEPWRAQDAARTANAAPAVFGLLRAVLAALEETGVRRRQPAAVALAAELVEETARVRAEAYRLVDEVPAGEELPRRLELRAWSTELAVRASAALVAAGAGSSMLRRSPAQRWAREALFHQIQAQTAPVREAQLARWASRGRLPDAARG